MSNPKKNPIQPTPNPDPTQPTHIFSGLGFWSQNPTQPTSFRRVNLKHNFLKKSSENNLINQIVFFWLIHFFWFSNARFSFDRSTHSVASRLILLLSIKIFRIDDVFVFVIESIGLLFSSIHRISVISRFLYDWRKFITSIISLFS